MNKALVAFVVILIIVIAITYVKTKFDFLNLNLHSATTTTIIETSSTIGNITTSASTTINASQSLAPCSSFEIIGEDYNTQYSYKCYSNSTETYGLWVASGNSGSESVMITGADGKSYVNQESSYNCTTFYQNFTAPSQIYTVTFATGSGGGSCGNALMKINDTTTPPPIIYNYIYNGNFKNGEYTGWNVTGAGFGSTPLNITYANNQSGVRCYQGSPWANYNGTFFATTYECGSNVAPGNLTSATFIVSATKPFLNFRMIEPQDNQLYVELLNQTYTVVGDNRVSVLTPLLIEHINTYNSSISINSSSTFANVSMALTPYLGHDLRVRVVAYSFVPGEYVAAGDFVLANRPNQQRGVIVNTTVV